MSDEKTGGGVEGTFERRGHPTQDKVEKVRTESLTRTSVSR